MLAAEFKRFDPGDMFGRIYGFPEQMDEAMEIGEKVKLRGDYPSPRAIAIAGMGGSAIAGDLLNLLISRSCEIPVAVSRNYRLPPWVGDDCLSLLLSYSGNTEETLSCLDDAMERNAVAVGITSGGKLKERMTGSGADVVTIPPGLPPRASLGYLAIPGLYFLKKIGIVSGTIEESLSRAADHLRACREEFSEPRQNNKAFEIARTIHDGIPVIYGGANGSAVVALRWKTQIEENGKMVAFHHSLPEMNHNEIVGFENNRDLLKKICVIWLEDRDDHPRIRLRQKLTREIIGTMAKAQIDVQSRGKTWIDRLFYLIYMGDWVSFWVAMLHRTDPTPVAKIDRLKQALST